MRLLKKYWKLFMGGLLLISILYYFSLPAVLFNDSYCTVLEDHRGNLLGATIATDGQWRFPETQEVPDHFRKAIILFEDRRFERHPGVDLLSLGRAMKQNLLAGKIVSGGSTLSMQVIRLTRKNRTRSIFEKCIEIILATRLELRYSKDEILALYASHAPFGGNVVGLEAACWRYFGRAKDQISWSEAALLAVLPNSPGLMHPGKNRGQLQRKRDHLLDRLKDAGYLDELTLALAKEEEIPAKPLPLPRKAPHLLDKIAKDGNVQQKVISTLDVSLQDRTHQIINDHFERLKVNQVYNAAAVILEVNTGNVLAYVGNTDSDPANDCDVDAIQAPRSTGSILKPFLFAAMLDEGKMLPASLVPDIPMVISGFSPKNFSREFDGAVPANQALIRSLNVPAVHELRTFRVEKFHNLLKEAGLTTLHHAPAHYGLSLILGGAEGKLWDITGMYASMARTLNHYFERPGKDRYNPQDYHAPAYRQGQIGGKEPFYEETSLLSAASVYLTFEALKELYRPGEGSGWKHFTSSKPIAWKTGTSYGFRDAWAVGVNPNYAVGVWVGNADGEGRPGLTGTEMAAPILFDIFSGLPESGWFKQPASELEEIQVCRKSGYRASAQCDQVDTVLIARAGLQSISCPYHKTIYLSADGHSRVHSECEMMTNARSTSWFVLPPVQEYYYRVRNLSYKSLPPYRKDCENPSGLVSMDLLYPKQGSRIFIPKELSGAMGSTVLEATHRNANTTIYWHLDGNFIAATRKSHRISLAPTNGDHVITLVDESGETVQRAFKVISGV